MSTRFALLVSKLAPADRAELMAALESASSRARLAERNAAIRTALAGYQGTATRRAKTLALELMRYVDTAWSREAQFDELPSEVSDRRRLLHKIAKSNGGKSLCWRRILAVADVCNPAV
jgi:hypothetical protein